MNYTLHMCMCVFGGFYFHVPFSSSMVAMVFLHTPTASSLPSITSHTHSPDNTTELRQNLRTIYVRMYVAKSEEINITVNERFT